MDKEYLNFLKDAYTGGLCEEYKNEIRACKEEKQKLVRLALRQQSIPYMATKLKEGIVTKEYIKQAFGGFLNGFILKDCDKVEGYTYAWYVDYDYANQIDIEVDVAHISFTKGANVVVPKTKCPTLYVSNGSDIHLICDGYNYVKVYLFDNSKVTIEDIDGESTVVVFRYDKKAKVKRGKYCLGKVKEYDKELRL